MTLTTILWLALVIIAAAVVIALILYKAGFQPNKITLKTPIGDAELNRAAPPSPPVETPPGVVISGNVQKGRDHEIEVNAPAQVKDNRQQGQHNQIRVGAPKKKQ